MSKLDLVLKNRSSLYLIDLYWVAYRFLGAYTIGYEVDGIFIPTSHYYGLCSTIEFILGIDRNACVIICDDSEPVSRIKLMEESGLEYKSGRVHEGYSFKNDVERIKAILCTIPNVYWSKMEDKESDDLLYAIAKQAERSEVFSGKIYIHSGDNDLLQAISSRVSVIRKREKNQFKCITNYELQNEDNFVKKFHGIDSEHIVNLRAIIGDSSDSIKGIPRFPRQLAVKVAKSTEDITKGYNYKGESATENKWLKTLDENKEIVDRNYRLMKLSDTYNVNISKPKVKIESVVSLLNELQLVSCRQWFESEHWI